MHNKFFQSISLKMVYKVFLLVIIVFNAKFAQNLVNNDENSINFKNIKVELENIEGFFNRDLSIKKSKQYINQLNLYRATTNECVEANEKKINYIDNQIKQYFGASSVLESNVSDKIDKQYLETQKAELNKKLSLCRFYKIRIDETLDLYHKKLLGKEKERALAWEKDIISLFISSPNDLSDLNIPKIKKLDFNFYFFQFIYFFMSCILSIYIFWQLVLNKKFFSYSNKKSFIIFCVLVIAFYLGLNCLFPKNIFVSNDVNEIFYLMLFNIFLLSFSGLFTLWLFTTSKVIILLKWQGIDVRLIKNSCLIFIFLYFFSQINIQLLEIMGAQETLAQLIGSCYFIIELIVVLILLVKFRKNNLPLFLKYKFLNFLFHPIVILTFLLIIIELVGYSNLSRYGADIIYSFVGVFLIGLLILSGINIFYKIINNQTLYKKKLKYLFGYNSEPPFYELLILKMLLQTFIVIFLIYSYFYFIDQLSVFNFYFYDYIKDGFSVYGFLFTPMQFFIAILFFCFLSLLSRFISKKISLNEDYDEENDNQVALASIFLYIGLSVSFIMSLLVAGFNFTSLAIIAGALSVGIGLGLQSIVNNFVSGIILLIEKPIKVGDRIIVNGFEGYVKKVRIRSTQIETVSLEDVIIPNSELITQYVTNYMFSNNKWKVKVEVGVAYGSDIDKVKQVLYDTVIENAEVIKNNKDKPTVYFSAFQESSLLFEVWCSIKNVNKKYMVLSDLNCAVDKAFKEHNIVIAFPQRDININTKSED